MLCLFYIKCLMKILISWPRGVLDIFLECLLRQVEAGADLTAVDRFGNHVEDLRTAAELGSLMSSSHAKLCDVRIGSR